MTYVEGLNLPGTTDGGRPPVKVGGVYKTTKPTLTNGQVSDFQLDVNGSQIFALKQADSSVYADIAALSSDATAASLAGLLVRAAEHLYNGATFERKRGANVFKPFASTAITAGTGATIWTPTSGKKFRLMGWLISSSVAGQLIFGDNLVGTVFWRSEALAAAGVSNPGQELDNGFLSAAANNVLKLDGPTGNVAGMVWGTEE